jgi:lysozyme family protein
MPVHHRYHHPPAIVMKVGDERPVPLTPELRNEYERLFSKQVANPKYSNLLKINLAKLISNAPRYKEVEARSHVPWYVVGVMHIMECDGRFDCHLHNGDPLAHKTVHVPAGRPNLDKWTWEDSAVDALEWEKKVSWDARGLDPDDWSLPAILYRLEAWNGFGARKRGVPTPFLWSGTTYYKTGKYGADGIWDSALRSQQVGAAPIIRALVQRKTIQFPPAVVK